MILQALASYHTRLEADPDADVAPLGFSRQKIVFEVVVDPDGSGEIHDARRQDGKRLVPLPLIVAGETKSSGSGLNPGFLWDNTAYMLGFKPDDPKPKRTAEAFAAFRKRHLAAEADVDDPGFSAVCRFLEKWNPEKARDVPFLAELTGGFGVFRLRAQTEYLHDRDKVLAYWRRLLEQAGDEPVVQGQCLITGQTTALARLHKPFIKGVLGAQSSGAALVSFNLDAFTSYGKEQSFNAPVGEVSAFNYATALNHLLREGSRQRLQIGDATVVFWTEKPTAAESFLGIVFDTAAAEDDAQKLKLAAILQQIATGGYPSDLGDAGTPFYILGLSPNASRLSVRFWRQSTLGDVVEKLHQHYADLALEHSERDPDFPAPWQILRETARESKDIPPLLGGALMRAILDGTPYPAGLYAAILRRIRADRHVGYVRAAAIKAYLNRNTRFGIQPLAKEVSVALDPDHPDPAYHLGRLFAALEKLQVDAHTDKRTKKLLINDTIKDRYFSAASATPRIVFPRIIRLSQHHLGKLETVGERIFQEKRIQEICAAIPAQAFPAHLSLTQQGLFALGYYHQRRAIFTTKPYTDNSDDTETIHDKE